MRFEYDLSGRGAASLIVQRTTQVTLRPPFLQRCSQESRSYGLEVLGNIANSEAVGCIQFFVLPHVQQLEVNLGELNACGYFESEWRS